MSALQKRLTTIFGLARGAALYFGPTYSPSIFFFLSLNDLFFILFRNFTVWHYRPCFESSLLSNVLYPISFGRSWKSQWSWLQRTSHSSSCAAISTIAMVLCPEKKNALPCLSELFCSKASLTQCDWAIHKSLLMFLSLSRIAQHRTPFSSNQIQVMIFFGWRFG